jgi:hypothetical protein
MRVAAWLTCFIGVLLIGLTFIDLIFIGLILIDMPLGGCVMTSRGVTLDPRTW